jgi:hypothetical protein
VLSPHIALPGASEAWMTEPPPRRIRSRIMSRQAISGVPAGESPRRCLLAHNGSLRTLSVRTSGSRPTGRRKNR